MTRVSSVWRPRALRHGAHLSASGALLLPGAFGEREGGTGAVRGEGPCPRSMALSPGRASPAQAETGPALLSATITRGDGIE